MTTKIISYVLFNENTGFYFHTVLDAYCYDLTKAYSFSEYKYAKEFLDKQSDWLTGFSVYEVISTVTMNKCKG